MNRSHVDPSQYKKSDQRRLNGRFLLLAMGALGVVFGDRGTSPRYAIKECFYGIHAITPNSTNIMGVLSLVFWSLTMVVSVKYVVFILRADNRGEGGIFTLLSLIPTSKDKISSKLRLTAVTAGILGAGLLYGEGIITLAISVLSAIEGLEVATKAATPAVLPFTCGVLLILFLMQSRGTARIGRIFGPIMVLWFASNAALGLFQVF
jgi:KUP system potassium uptake protein